MAFFGDVNPGDPFRPSAGLSNGVRHLLNRLDGFGGNAVPGAGGSAVRIQVYNACECELGAGLPVNFTSEKPLAGGALPVAELFSPYRPWGVLLSSLPPGGCGDCVVAGSVEIAIDEEPCAGENALPRKGGFFSGAAGVPILWRGGGRAVICLGSGMQSAYDGPFALSYDVEADLIRAKPGLLCRNGWFSAAPELACAPMTGYVSICSHIGEDGSWTAPELAAGVFAMGTPNVWPVGFCTISDAGEVLLESYRTPVAFILETAVCRVSNGYEGR